MKNTLGRIVAIGAILIAAQAANAGITISDLDDLNYWGSGTNRSALVIDWNDGKSSESLAWGFRWSGTLSVSQMLASIAAADSRLSLRIDSASAFGLAIFGIGYQTGASPFGVTGAQDTGGGAVVPTFTAGIDDLNATAGTDAPASSASASPLNTADHYKEGWNDNGFWQLYFSGSDTGTATGTSTLPAMWTGAFVGSDDATLVDQGWYAFSIANPDFSSNIPDAPMAAVPEPGSAFLVLCGFGGILATRRRRHSASI